MFSRRGWLLAPYFALLKPASVKAQPDDFTQRVLDHERPWNLFIRKKFGCPYPNGEITLDNCKKEDQIIDAENFRAAGESAKKLWNLKDA